MKKYKSIRIDLEAFEILSNCSKQSGHTIKDLISLLIVANINFLKNPVKIAKKFSMVKEKKQEQIFSF